MSIALKWITAFLIEPHLRVKFLGDIEQKWVR